MARKRNFTRHNVTVVFSTDPMSGGTYYRVKGLVTPPPEFYQLEIDPTGVSVSDKLELYVKAETMDFIGQPKQWFFLWEGRVYVILATRDYTKMGKDSYVKYVGIYDSRNTGSYLFTEPNWDELYGEDGFIPAVDSVEIVVEMKLDKVLDKRI